MYATCVNPLAAPRPPVSAGKAAPGVTKCSSSRRTCVSASARTASRAGVRKTAARRGPEPVMSLYQLQKFLYDINREPGTQARYRADLEGLLDRYELTAEERGAIARGDIGLIYVLGANGQLLMHFAALLGMPWADYIEAMREGVRRHGPVRAGIYAMT